LTNTGAARIRTFDIVSDKHGLRGVFAIGNYMHSNVSTDDKFVTVFKSVAI